MRERPCDTLDMAISALCGVCDLLVQASKPGRGDMHLVDPADLGSVLELIRDRLRLASDGLRKSA